MSNHGDRVLARTVRFRTGKRTTQHRRNSENAWIPIGHDLGAHALWIRIPGETHIAAGKQRRVFEDLLPVQKRPVLRVRPADLG
jgi:hypothetical protein